MTLAIAGTRPESRFETVRALLGALAMTAAAGLYYAHYIDVGFNFADDGHYAQVAYELWRGTDPHDIRFGYGLAWFLLGKGLFTLVGPSHLAVQALFHTMLAVTAGLVFAAVERVTRSLPAAVLAAAAAAIVPAFPATAFYAFCTLVNLLPQASMARRWRTLAPLGAVPGALALAVTFQIRPDFGYAFALPFGLILAASGAAQGLRRFAAMAGAALAAFAAAHLPLVLAGLMHGTLDLVVADYGRYPGILLRLVRAGLDRTGTETAAAGAGTLLPRPPLSALWTGPRAAAEQAFVVYAPIVGLAGFALLQCVRMLGAVRRGSGQAAADRLMVAGVLLAAPLVSFPHYFLFRPDLAHVANFMPGYEVLLAVLVWELAGGDLAAPARAPRRWPPPAGILAGLALLAGLGVYVMIGLSTPGTGSIAVLNGRDSRFTGANGVAVRVSESERLLFEELKRLIDAAGGPGEAIVCVPFCPGIAFLAGRRMLFGEFYVDDSLLISDPGWIERAIRRTRDARPPVVVIFDWALNGTDISRFAVWARPYVAFLETAGYRRIDLPNVAVYLRP